MGVHVQKSLIDGLIANFINITIDDKKCVDHENNVEILFIHLILQSFLNIEPLDQYNPLSLKKLKEEWQKRELQAGLYIGHQKHPDINESDQWHT